MGQIASHERRPLSVLLTTQFLDGRTGSEIVVRDRALALRRLGHAPVVYSPFLGPMADEIRDASIPVVDYLNAIDRSFDLIHASHHATLAAAVARFPATPVLSAHQDFVAGIDQPWPFANVRFWMACDDTVADGLVSQGGVPADRLRVLLNGVDTGRFRPGAPLPARPRRALAFAKNSQHVEAVTAACAAAGIGCDFIGPAVGTVVEEVEAVLPHYDLVFASGLAALEAMACGRAVIVCDGRGLAGFCDEDAWTAWRPLNFGLRSLTRRPTQAALLEEIARYDAAAASEVAGRCRVEASLDRCVAGLVELYREVVEAHAADPVAPEAVSRDLAAYLQAWGGQIELRRARRLLGRAVPLTRDLAELQPLSGPLSGGIDTLDHAPLKPLNVVGRGEAAVVQGWTLPDGHDRPAAGVRRLLVVNAVDDPAMRYVAVLDRAVPRPDLAATFPAVDPRHYETAGFSERIDFAALAPGRYRLGLACRRDDRIETRMFDRLVEVV